MANHATVSRVSEAVARPARTGVQGGVAWAILEFISAYELYDFTERQLIVTTVVLTAVVSYLQNAFENHRSKGLFLRDVPPTKSTLGGT